MSWRAAVTWALFLALIFSPALIDAAPRRRPRGRTSPQHELDVAAKRVDLFKAISDKQVEAVFSPQSSGLALLHLLNIAEQPLTVEVPLMLGARPQVPPGGANQNSNLAFYGTPEAPAALAGAVSPQWSGVGVEKKRAKRRPPKKPAVKVQPADDEESAAPTDESADDDAKPAAKPRTRKPAKPAKTNDESADDKPADDKKPQGDSTVAVVPLPAGAEQSLPLIYVGVEWGKADPLPVARYELTELEETTKSSEIKTLLEQLGQGKIPDQGVAQVLAWRYTSRMSWEELASSGRILLPRIEAAKQLDEKITGGKVGDK